MNSLPTPPYSGSARSRRGERYSSGESSRGQFWISAVKYRVGAPPLPPLPYEYKDHDVPKIEQLKARFGDILERQAEALLDHHNITQWQFQSGKDEDFVEQIDPGFYADNIPILFQRSLPETEDSEIVLSIIANWESDSLQTWEAATRDIKNFIDRKLDDAGLDGFDIGVEIMAPEVRVRRHTSVVEYNADLIRDWPEIKDHVFTVLQRFSNTKNQMTSISLFRFGLSEIRDRNPITVYVSVSYDVAENTWQPVIEAIQTYLNQLPYSLMLHLEHREIVPYNFQHLPATLSDLNTPPPFVKSVLRINKEYLAQPVPGSDISPAKYLFQPNGKKDNSAMGTFGCYIKIKTLNEPTWKSYGLTNYHVVGPCIDGFRVHPKGRVDGPILGSDAHRAEQYGFVPSRTENMAALESPSRKKHNYTLTHMALRISYTEKRTDLVLSPERRAELVGKLSDERERRIQFFENGSNILGMPWCGSGLRTRSENNARLDWALFRVKDARLGSNILPPVEDLEDEYNTPIRLLDFNPDRSLEKLGTNMGAILKAGAMTGRTAGYVSMYKTDVRMWTEAGDFERSTEYCVITGSNEDMAQPGDSGSVAYNIQGEIVGLVFSGPSHPTCASRYAFVTPIEDIFKHMKQLSKGKITDIRVAGS